MSSVKYDVKSPALQAWALARAERLREQREAKNPSRMTMGAVIDQERELGEIVHEASQILEKLSRNQGYTVSENR